MAIPTVGLDETKPAGTRSIKLGDDDIREYKTQNREVLEVDHDYPSSGNSDTAGQHKKVTLQEQDDLGTGAEGVPILGAQTIGGKAELVFTDEDDNDVQLTSGGVLDLGSGNLDNDEYITATDNAGTGSVNVVKANASDQVEIGAAALADGGVILPEITAPTTAANQGALYTKNDGTQTELYFREESDGDEVKITSSGTINGLRNIGAVSAKSAGTIYQASTDGFVFGYVSSALSNNVSFNSVAIGTSSPPSDYLLSVYPLGSSSNPVRTPFCIPVAKDEYYKLTLGTGSSGSIQFRPLS